jgi:serine/threonine protein kinase
VECPDEGELVGFLGRGVTHERRREIEGHFDGCGDCRELAFVLATNRQVPGTADDAISPGPHIGRFVVEELIAEGAMGMIYRAHDASLRRDVALKLLRIVSRGPAEAGEAHARMLREAQGLARLEHPNVVTVYETGLHGDEVFIAMELIDGVSLDRWLASQRRSWRQIAFVLEQAGRGLAAAHAAGLVHRDFKPENVLCGDDGRVRVTDFGLARGDVQGSG